MSDIQEAVLQGGPTVERLKLEIIRRDLVVKDVVALTPGMVRVTLAGEDLEGFHSPSPDDHIKLFFTSADGTIGARDYTPRRFDAGANQLVIDFVLHEGGVGAGWAQRASAGDRLQIGGPRGSAVVDAKGGWWMLIGDETAMPSIGRRLEELAEETQVVCLVAVRGTQEQLEFDTKADVRFVWVHRADATDAAPVIEALRGIEVPGGPGYVWIAAEAGVARDVRSYVVEELKHPAEWVKASAYWTHGE